MVLHGYYSPGFGVSGALTAFSEFDLKSSKTSELDRIAGENCALYLFEKRIDETVNLFPVDRSTDVEGFNELGLRDFTSHYPLLRARYFGARERLGDVSQLPRIKH